MNWPLFPTLSFTENKFMDFKDPMYLTQCAQPNLNEQPKGLRIKTMSIALPLRIICLMAGHVREDFQSEITQLKKIITKKSITKKVRASTCLTSKCNTDSRLNLKQ